MRQRINNLLRPTLLVFTFAAIVASQLFAPSAWAARVLKTKGNNVLVDLEGDASSATVGDKYFVMVNGKKRGLVSITKIKGGKALANLDKGTAQAGAPMSLARASGGGSGGGGGSQASSAHQKTGSSRRHREDRLDQLRVGALIGDSIDTQSVKLTENGVSETVKMHGSGVSLKGFATIPLSGNLGLTARGGFEIFHVTGTSSAVNGFQTGICTGSPTTECYTKVTYFTVDALLRYGFPQRSWTPFVEAGLGIYLPLSKSTTALNPNISTTSLFTIGAGADINIGKNGFIPIVLEYGFFPPSSDVSSGAISIRLGYGVRI